MEKKKPVIITDVDELTREEWLLLRKRGIGGSDVARILGVSKWGTATDLYMDKISPETEKKEPDNWFSLDYGNMIEPLIRKWYAKATGYEVINDTNMYQHPDYPWMIADVDFIIRKPDGTIMGGEIKTTSPRSADADWREGILGCGGMLPYYYEVQVRHYMAVLDLPVFVVLCCYGNLESNIIPVLVYRDEDIEKKIIEAEAEFWNEHVIPRRPPADGISPETLYAVRQSVKPEEDEGDYVLSPDTEELLAAYLSLKDEKKVAEAEVDRVKKLLDAATAEIIMQSAGHKTARLDKGDGSYYFVKNNTIRKRIPDSEKLKLNYPEIWLDVEKEISYDTTSVKIKKVKKEKGAK